MTLKHPLFFLLAFWGWNSIHGQDIVEKFKTDSDPYFLTIKIPEEMKEEPSILLAQKEEYEFVVDEKKWVKINYAVRQKILLDSRSSVEYFSKFYYPIGDQLSLRIIKPNGRKIEVKPENIIEFTLDEVNSVPNFFKSSFEGDVAYNKFALPGLEEGDVLDYCRSRYDFKPIEGKITPLPQIFEYLGVYFPVVKHRIEVSLEPNFLFRRLSANGLPDFREIPAADGHKKYFIEFTNQPRLEATRWDYPRRLYPHIQFQGIYSKKGELPDEIDRHSGNSDPRSFYAVIEKSCPTYSEEGSSLVAQLGEQVRDFYKNTLLISKDASLEDKAPHIYNGIKVAAITRPRIIGKYGGPYNALETEPREFFLRALAAAYKKERIDFDWVALVPRFFGKVENLFTVEDVRWGLRLNFAEPKYVFDGGKHGQYNVIPYEYADAEAIVYRKGETPALIHIPKTGWEGNMNKVKGRVSWIEGTDSLSFARNTQLIGQGMNYFQHRMLAIKDYYQEDAGTYSAFHLYQPSNLDVIVDLIHRSETKKIEAFREGSLRNEFGMVTPHGFKVILQGRGRDSEIFAYADTFVIRNLVTQGGPNYVLKVGELIGSQVDLGEEDYERKVDIYMDFARAFENELIIEIPEGYEVEGIENLNMQVENETGKFESSAEMQGNELIINTMKIYKNNEEPLENWPKMIEFLDAGYEFTQQKVLLRKVN